MRGEDRRGQGSRKTGRWRRFGRGNTGGRSVVAVPRSLLLPSGAAVVPRGDGQVERRPFGERVTKEPAFTPWNLEPNEPSSCAHPSGPLAGRARCRHLVGPPPGRAQVPRQRGSTRPARARARDLRRGHGRARRALAPHPPAQRGRGSARATATASPPSATWATTSFPRARARRCAWCCSTSAPAPASARSPARIVAERVLDVIALGAILVGTILFTLSDRNILPDTDHPLIIGGAAVGVLIVGDRRLRVHAPPRRDGPRARVHPPAGPRAARADPQGGRLAARRDLRPVGAGGRGVPGRGRGGRAAHQHQRRALPRRPDQLRRGPARRARARSAPSTPRWPSAPARWAAAAPSWSPTCSCCASSSTCRSRWSAWSCSSRATAAGRGCAARPGSPPAGRNPVRTPGAEARLLRLKGGGAPESRSAGGHHRRRHAARPSGRRPGRCGSSPGVCLVLAALSLFFYATPTYDPWAWILWGREIAHLDLLTEGGPSWKPLPVVFTTVFSLFGEDTAPGAVAAGGPDRRAAGHRHDLPRGLPPRRRRAARRARGPGLRRPAAHQLQLPARRRAGQLRGADGGAGAAGLRAPPGRAPRPRPVLRLRRRPAAPGGVALPGPVRAVPAACASPRCACARCCSGCWCRCCGSAPSCGARARRCAPPPAPPTPTGAAPPSPTTPRWS